MTARMVVSWPTRTQQRRRRKAKAAGRRALFDRITAVWDVRLLAEWRRPEEGR